MDDWVAAGFAVVFLLLVVLLYVLFEFEEEAVVAERLYGIVGRTAGFFTYEEVVDEEEDGGGVFAERVKVVAVRLPKDSVCSVAAFKRRALLLAVRRSGRRADCIMRVMIEVWVVCWKAEVDGRRMEGDDVGFSQP